MEEEEEKGVYPSGALEKRISTLDESWKYR